jgi:SNF2 family DNA or RNA helicase
VETFEQQDDIRIMLISNVGSAGLNLTAASVVIFLVSHPPVVWLS